MVEATIGRHFETTRAIIVKLSQKNLSVIEQYEATVQNLKNGIGLREADLHTIPDAIAITAKKHQDQTHKDQHATPYIIHPLGVSNYLLTIGQIMDPQILIGALLHDTVKDAFTTFEEIDHKFGTSIGNFVREVTDDPQIAEGAALIKLADMLYNLTDLKKSPPADREPERVEAYFDWAQQVVDRLPQVNNGLKQSVDAVITEFKHSIKSRS